MGIHLAQSASASGSSKDRTGRFYVSDLSPCCDKTPNKSNLRKESLLQSAMVGKAQHGDLEASGHMAPAVRKQREMDGGGSAHLLPFLQSRVLVYRLVPSRLSVSLLPQLASSNQSFTGTPQGYLHR